ncbi:Hypothetical predicted protein [Paramuricea clavata]|uniref:Uncharacterized protein n=1 Tax=Paramuricea clavata TaxID=317549 RepID=A0A6S7JNI0_PARCT|nr:Hypothetical predicted protein [Paramuricea clavata]
MGIQGLQSFVEIQCSNDAWGDIDFKELNQSLSHGKTSNAPSVLVVDAMSCLKHFYASNTDWVCGGQWNELLRNVENFVKAFRQIDIELVVFFDGEQDTAKIQSWIQEEEEYRQLVHQILSHVHNTATFPPKRHFFAPKSISTCLRLAFRSRDVVVCSTVGDLHKEIINYCKRHSCLGILGYHSDYLLLDAMSYYSSSHLKIVKRCGATSMRFNTDVIFRELELDRSRLALFSTLLGNSFLPEEWLAQFHWSLLGPDHPLAKLQAQVGKQFILPPYDVVVRSVAKYVRDLVDISDLQAIMVQVFRSPETTEADFLHRLQRSIQHYSNDSSDEVKENGESESPSNYPTVSTVPKTDVLSSPSNGTSESNYQKRWQHWQQHQFVSGELFKTSSKISNGISPSSSEPDVEKLVADVQQLQLKELDLKGPDQQDLLSPTQTLSAPDTPSTPTQEAFLLASPGTPETPKAFDAATSPVVFPPTEESAAIAGEVSTEHDDPASQDATIEAAEVPSPTASTDSEPTPPIPASQLSPVRERNISPSSSDDKSNEKPLSVFYAFISPEVLKTAKKRHEAGQMMEMVYQVLSKGEIKIGAALEDENSKGRASTALLYRSIRQRVYGILLDKKLYDSAGAEQPRTPPPSIREWCIYGGKKLEKPDMVEPLSLKWDVPGCKQLWLGTQPSDNTNRLKAFLSCMLSDSPSMTKTTMVPQRCIILCCVLRYLIQKQTGHPILRAQELEAFLAQALSPHLTTECNVTNLSQIKVNKVDVRGVNLATVFMRGVETAIFANDSCGSPIPWDLVCPWNYFDGKLFQSKLNITMSDSATLLDLCDGNVSICKF